MARDILYFDLETQRTANDVGGWENKHQMGMSIGVTYSTGTGEYHIYTEKTVEALIAQLRRADLVIGFNHIHFDYGVLGGYYPFDLTMELRSLDLMTELEGKLGHRPKLEDVASATLGVGKTAEGLQAIRWWQQGKLAEIAEYCAFDVKVTKCVHEHGVQHGHVKYRDKNGREQTLGVDWK
jgi:DEAD/DEAH box helicase domain-containing protein